MANTVTMQDEQGNMYDVPADELNGASLKGLKLVDGYDDPSPGMGDVQNVDRQSGEKSGWLMDAMSSFANGIGKSRISQFLIPQEEMGELRQYAREAQQNHPKTAAVANFAGEMSTPESVAAGQVMGGALKLGMGAQAVGRAAKAVGLKPWLAPNAGAAKMKWNSKAIQDAVGALQAARDTVPGVGAAAGGLAGHAMGGGYGVGAEFGAVAGDTLGRLATGLPPVTRGGFWHAAMAPAADIGRTLASPVTSPAVEFQAAKVAPWLARLAGRPTEE